MKIRTGAHRERLRRFLVVGGAVALAVGLGRWQLTRKFTAGVRYVTERRLGTVEIRRYPALVVAETTLGDVPWRAALEEGFRRLAAYIRGRGSPSRGTIAMTTPVLVAGDGDRRTVQFIMPQNSTKDSLPPPRDSRVELREVPARRVAAKRFRGRYDERLVRAQEQELLERLREAGLRVQGEVTFAGYDPPWTLPFLRRLEAWAVLDG